MTGQRKDQRLAGGEREGSNLIWLEEDVCVCAHMHGCDAQCEGTVGMGQEGCAVEWSLQSQKQWGVSPDALIPGPGHSKRD